MAEVRVKDPSQYPPSLKFVLDVITINEKANVVGSAKYLGMKYAGDVDVFDPVNVNMDKEAALKMYETLISTIASEILMTDRKIIFNEFKAGIDKRFELEGDRKNFIYSLCKQNLITNKEHLYLNSLNDIKFDSSLKSLYVLKWTLTELIKKQKKLRKGKIITLREALGMTSLVKMDVISYIESRLQSIELVYVFKYQGKNIQELGDYE